MVGVHQKFKCFSYKNQGLLSSSFLLCLFFNLRENHFDMKLNTLTHSFRQSLCISDLSSGHIWTSEVLEGAALEVRHGVLEKRECGDTIGLPH